MSDDLTEKEKDLLRFFYWLEQSRSPKVEFSGDEQEKLFKWWHGNEIRNALMELLAKGLVKIGGVSEDGEPKYFLVNTHANANAKKEATS